MESPIEQSASDRLAAAVKALEERQAQLKRALVSFKKGAVVDPCAAQRWLLTNRSLLEKEAPAVLDLAAEIEARCLETVDRFEADLREALMGEGLSLSGHWPRYYVEHIIQVVVDEVHYAVVVGGVRLQTLAADAVVASLRAQLKILKPLPAKLPDFLCDLYEAYVKLASTQTPTVSVWALYREMVIGRQPRKFWRDASSANFSQFTEPDFRAHLTELLKADLTVISSHQLRLLPPISKDESLFIYQPAEKRFAHVGRIEFISVRGEENDG
jgi:hypothetical protein